MEWKQIENYFDAGVPMKTTMFKIDFFMWYGAISLILLYTVRIEIKMRRKKCESFSTKQSSQFSRIAYNAKLNKYSKQVSNVETCSNRLKRNNLLSPFRMFLLLLCAACECIILSICTCVYALHTNNSACFISKTLVNYTLNHFKVCIVYTESNYVVLSCGSRVRLYSAIVYTCVWLWHWKQF